MSETIDIPVKQDVPLDTMEYMLKLKSHMELWDFFSHSINKECKAEAKVDENGYVWIRVFAEATHTYGDLKDFVPPKITHGAGFIIHLSDMWLLTSGYEPPYRHCDLCKNRTKGKLPSPFDDLPV